VNRRSGLAGRKTDLESRGGVFGESKKEEGEDRAGLIGRGRGRQGGGPVGGEGICIIKCQANNLGKRSKRTHASFRKTAEEGLEMSRIERDLYWSMKQASRALEDHQGEKTESLAQRISLTKAPQRRSGKTGLSGELVEVCDLGKKVIISSYTWGRRADGQRGSKTEGEGRLNRSSCGRGGNDRPAKIQLRGGRKK